MWGPWVLVHARFVWALWASLVGIGFDSEHEFASPIVLLGLLLCPWTWGISSQPLQCLPSYWGFSDLGRGVSPHSWSSWAQQLLQTLNVGYLKSPCVGKQMSYRKCFYDNQVPGKDARWHLVLSHWLLLLSRHSVMSDSLWLHGLEHARLPCPSPGACSNSCPLSRWCHQTISSSVIPFLSCLQSFPASGSFLSQFFASGGQTLELQHQSFQRIIRIDFL